MVEVAILIFAFFVLIGITLPDHKPVTRTHKGIELMAHGGKLIHVRETESEREI